MKHSYPTSEPLKFLLQMIHNREMALPDFQRDFVWDPSATDELIESIISNFPAGSLLRIKNGTQLLFQPRAVEGAPSLAKEARPSYLILDGQQRLTSLYQAFYGVGEHRYYIDLKQLIDGADFEEAISYERAKTKRVKARESFEHQAKELILPLSVLKTGAGGFLDWMLNVTGPMPSDQRTQMLDALKKIN